MKQRKLSSVLRHSGTMARRNLKTYALLSVTIVLSFSLLLGFLLYTDASLYNQYKDLFGQRRGDVLISDSGMNTEKVALLAEHLDEMDSTSYYITYFGHFGHYTTQFALRDYEEKANEVFTLQNLTALFVPNGAWADALEALYCPVSDIIWLDGQEHETIELETDQVILSNRVYFALELDQQTSPVFELRSSTGVRTNLRVAGYYCSQLNDDLLTIENWLFTPEMLLSTKLIAAENLTEKYMELESQTPLISSQHVIVYSEHPEQVDQLAQDMHFDDIDCVYSRQNAALEKIRSEKSNKAIIACALLLLLRSWLQFGRRH